MGPIEQPHRPLKPFPTAQHNPETTGYLTRPRRDRKQGIIERKATRSCMRRCHGSASKSENKDSSIKLPQYDKSVFKRVHTLFQQRKYQECWAACLWGLYEPDLPELLQMDLLRVMGKLKISKAQEFYDVALQLWDEIDDKSTKMRAFRVHCVQEKEQLKDALARNLPDLVKHEKVNLVEDLGTEETYDSDEDSFEVSDARLDALIAERTTRLAVRFKQLEKTEQPLEHLKDFGATATTPVVAGPANGQEGLLCNETTGEEVFESEGEDEKVFEDKTLDEILQELEFEKEEDTVLGEMAQVDEAPEEALLQEDAKAESKHQSSPL